MERKKSYVDQRMRANHPLAARLHLLRLNFRNVKSASEPDSERVEYAVCAVGV